MPHTPHLSCKGATACQDSEDPINKKIWGTDVDVVQYLYYVYHAIHRGREIETFKKDLHYFHSTTTFSEPGKMTPLKLGTGIKVGVPDFNSIGLHQKQMALLVPDVSLLHFSQLKIKLL